MTVALGAPNVTAPTEEQGNPMRTIEVTVSKELIDIARERHQGNCAVALALQLVSDDIGWVRVDRDKIRFTSREDSTRYTFRSPEEVRHCVDWLDAGGRNTISPFSFQLNPDEAISKQPKKTQQPLKPKPDVITAPRPGKRQVKHGVDRKAHEIYVEIVRDMNHVDE
jgi:hypothetical protein